MIKRWKVSGDGRMGRFWAAGATGILESLTIMGVEKIVGIWCPVPEHGMTHLVRTTICTYVK